MQDLMSTAPGETCRAPPFILGPALKERSALREGEEPGSGQLSVKSVMQQDAMRRRWDVNTLDNISWSVDLRGWRKKY